MKLTQERLKELLHYNPETGDFTWLMRTNNRIHIGDIAGSPDRDGYLRISIDSVQYSAHRLAWFYMNGAWPIFEIDHENTVKNDNRWLNLRDKTHSFNMQNQRKARSDNSTGFLGVYPKGSGFGAAVTLDEKQNYLGTHPTPEEAHAEYLKAKRELHPGCTI